MIYDEQLPQTEVVMARNKRKLEALDYLLYLGGKIGLWQKKTDNQAYVMAKDEYVRITRSRYP